ncbi:hypothetical protein [Pseudoduganella chitinolytica]|uniref:PsbP C-terminal domain-containing protein n=1 Tax=Pseudoduganella chitinolytica TaxID=34070 RepID=A0ABY8B6M3_9BURK|nr:hypothetical protein [Pseudoduganella chitinolytica]WEF31589.1 hypothetical protein PX653_19300 [Pseudoduganella chitinolytica]
MKKDTVYSSLWMGLTTVLAASIMGAGFAADVTAADELSKPIPLPDVQHTTSYSKRGVKLALPGNWTVTRNETESKVVQVDLEANKPGFEGIALNTQIQIYPLSMAPSLQETAEFLTKLAREDSKYLTATKYQPLQISGAEALGARYIDNNFNAGDPYAKHFHIYARKGCGKGFVCIVYTQTLEVNEQAARLGLDKVVSTLRYSR